MLFEESVRYLLSLGRELASSQQPSAQKFGLRNSAVLAERLGHPQRSYPCVHIAGTNGKGSTAAMLESCLRAAGLRTGLYTSPHLERMNERIRVAGEDISDADFAESFARLRALIESSLASGSLEAHPTFFECLTAMAFDYFARRKVDCGVFEVGMGGRLDATNILEPAVAVITQIDFDHENFLGHSIEEITSEKAGIIKQGAWVVSAVERPEARAVILRRCSEMDARLTEVDSVYRLQNLQARAGSYRFSLTSARGGESLELALPLPGRFQVRNALAAVTAARLLAERGLVIDDAAIARGLSEVRWPGRLELLQEHPAVYLDGMHNPSAARELLAFWNEHCAGRKIHLVYGSLRDKAVDEISGLLFPRAASVILTQPRQSRALSADALASMTRHLNAKIERIPDCETALDYSLSLASSDDAVFVAGSLYLVGDLRRAWFSRKQPYRAPSH